MYLKKRISSSNFFHLRIDVFKGFIVQNSKQEGRNLYPFVQMAEKQCSQVFTVCDFDFFLKYIISNNLDLIKYIVHVIVNM